MSYEYLGENVIPVKLAKEVGRVEEKVVPLSPKDEERAKRLHAESILIDLHIHLTILPENLQDMELLTRSGRPAMGFEGVKKSGMTACLSGYGGSHCRRSSPAPWQFQDVVWDLGIRTADIDHHADVVMRAYSVRDILEAKKSGKTAILAMIENAQMIDNDLDRVDVLYGLGYRSLGVTFNARTTVGDGCTERSDAGLSSFGFKVIERMNRLGMLIDLSHSSDLTSRETIEASKAPCCFSHTFARGVFNNPRGKSDELLKLLAQKGGVIGIAAVPNLISRKPVQAIFDVLDHLDYIVKLVGIDHVAIGTDCMFGDHVAFHKQMLKIMGLPLSEFPAACIDYIENPGEWPNFTRALVARGYTDADIKKILGENVLRILKQVIG